MALNVLVVDDSVVTRKMIVRVLRLCDFPLGIVHEAENGREGLLALTKFPVDLVLADINMPVMTGEEMILSMKKRPDTADLPVVVVSTEGSETRIGDLKRVGATFVRKPFTPEQLQRTIQEALIHAGR